MNKSESIKNLAAALHQAQAEMPAVPMDSEGHYHKYASLGAVIDTTRPVLENHGLSLSQFATSENGDVGVTTILMHTSGEWIEDTITLPLVAEERKSLAQVAGASITYLRRYSWAAVLGLYSDEDTDGEGVARAQPAPEARRGKKPPSGEPTNVSELYAMSLELSSIEHTNHARIVMQEYLNKKHGGGDIGAFCKMAPGNIKVLWSVLVEYDKRKAAELE